MKFSQTKVTTWQRCHAAYNFRYNLKLRKKRSARPLVFGKIVHTMVESDANGGNAFTALQKIDHEQGRTFRKLEEEYGKIVEDVEDIMTDYFQYWGEHDHLQYVKMGNKRSEFTFEVEIAKDIIANGKIDNIAVTPNKLRWLVEHKTGRSYPNEDHRWRSLQSALYIRILDIAGATKKLDGTMWDFIRSKPPTRPQILKNGELSTRAIDTLPSTVRRFVREENLKMSQVVGLMKAAAENRSAYFKRTFSPVKKPVIDMLFNDFISAARQIADQGHKLKDKHIGQHCDWCPYESICRTELKGHDVDFIKKADYVVEDKPEEEDIDIEA